MAPTAGARIDRPTFIDLFAGCGGLALGFLYAGFRAVGACETDRDAVETYRRNIDDAIFDEPIETVANARWPQADVVIGGPPCQGFSPLNRDGVGSNGALSGANTCARSTRAAPACS